MRSFRCTRNTPRPLHTLLETKLGGASKIIEIPALAFFETDAAQVIVAILLA